ncbi:MAG: flagellar basal body rod protein FlgC [Fibrobacteria bacterium]|nr:flagellar basal body rod protein FlgC [Fibrobacteria bacterium]
MGMFTSLNISATGLRAQRVRQNVIASNLANAETTRTDEGGPYQRQVVQLQADPKEADAHFVFGQEQLKGFTSEPSHMRIPNPELPIKKGYIGSGVQVAGIVKDGSAPRMVYDPTHPDASENGYVAMPNVNVVQEMTDMITATRAYEACVTAFNSSKSMLMKTLELI